MAQATGGGSRLDRLLKLLECAPARQCIAPDCTETDFVFCPSLCAASRVRQPQLGQHQQRGPVPRSLLARLVAHTQRNCRHSFAEYVTPFTSPAPPRVALHLAHPRSTASLTRACVVAAQLRPLLASHKWETRVAAGEAIAALAERTAHSSASHGDDDGTPLCCCALVTRGLWLTVRCWLSAEPVGSAHAASEGLLSFDSFDMDRVLAFGTPLLASGGQVSSVRVVAGEAVCCD